MRKDNVIIMNPSAHDWEAGEQWPALTSLLGACGVDFDLLETGPGLNATALAQQAAETGYGRVVAVGGDGTVHEVINGLMRARVPRRPTLALIPFGTANDISKSFNITSYDLEETVRTISEGLDYPLDLGLLDGERYFADAFTIGYDADVLKDRNAMRAKRHLFKRGIESYLPSMAKEALFYAKATADIDVDGRAMRAKIYNLVVKNTRMYAGSFVLNSRIRGNDGKLDVFLFEQGQQYWSEIGTQLTKKVTVVADPTGFSGELMDIIVRNYRDFQARSVGITLSRPTSSQVDGEQYRTADRFTVTCIKGALTLKVPYPY